MISREEFSVIHTLYKRGYSIRAISKIVGINRRTVTKRLKEGELKPYNKPIYKSKLDSYKDYIIKRVQQASPETIPSSVIYNEIKEYGYDGKLRILQSFLSSLTKPNKPKEEEIRFETKAGYQSQVDWTVIRSGKNPIYGFTSMAIYFT